MNDTRNVIAVAWIVLGILALIAAVTYTTRPAKSQQYIQLQTWRQHRATVILLPPMTNPDPRIITIPQPDERPAPRRVERDK